MEGSSFEVILSGFGVRLIVLGLEVVVEGSFLVFSMVFFKLR